MLVWPFLAQAQPALKVALFEVAPYAQKEGGALHGLYIDLVRGWVPALASRPRLR
ncbi:hypothetical protein ABT392_08130 [Paucibacter sp. JuS9]|uniref:hypothetical protein n=1 Tax=Paucibacter sp. JuS9 TaxID=3228748 RepID=UPI00375795E8